MARTSENSTAGVPTGRRAGDRARPPTLSPRRLVALACAATVLAGLGGAAVQWLAEGGQVLLGAAVAGLVCALVVPWVAALAWRLLRPAGPAALEEGLLRATRDDLTGLHNRRHFMALAERELARCRRYQTAGALLLVDADHFKRVNDAHGHACGDALLREITRVAQTSLRQPDLLARFGGEELIVFLPQTDPLGALDVADRIRERVSAIKLPWQGAHIRSTVSIGVAAVDPSHATLDLLLQEANAALFAAKEAGRNCVRAAPIEPRRSSGEASRVPSNRH